MSLFLNAAELVALTGRKLKTKQIEALRKMGITFWVNACGKPVVPRVATEGGKQPPRKKEWDLPG